MPKLPQRPTDRLPTSPLLKDQWLDWVQYAADIAFWATPRRLPPAENIRATKLIAHRGAHHRDGPRENTLEAFQLAADAGAWGIEFDVRWTRDLVPVVIHDADCQRAFSVALSVGDSDFSELREKVPQVPSLEEVVQRFGKQLHLMIETKCEPWVDQASQQATLSKILSGLAPGDDYHWMGIEIDFLRSFDLVPKKFRIPITFFEVDKFGKIVLEEGYAGLGGHYLLLNNRLLKQFKKAGKQFGVGFPSTENALRREMHRGVEWVFTNDIERVGPIYKKLLAQVNS